MMMQYDDTLYGVKYWAQWMAEPKIPKFELFQYVGYAPVSGMYYFQHRKIKTLFISKSLYQLRSDVTFKPFMYDTSLLNIVPMPMGVV